MDNTPKYFEQSRRDKTSEVAPNHSCKSFQSNSEVPPKWRQDVLNCRMCKRALVKFLTDFFLENIGGYLNEEQRFYTAGGFDGLLQHTAWYASVTAVLSQIQYTIAMQAKRTCVHGCMHTTPKQHKYLSYLQTQILITLVYLYSAPR